MGGFERTQLTTYELLQQEYRTLEQAFVSRFDSRIFELVSDEHLLEITKEWADLISDHSETFNNIADFGIILWTNDLQKQDIFVGTNLKEIAFDEKADFSHASVLDAHAASKRTGEVLVKAKKPTGREQIEHFITTGVVHPTVEDFLHELSHQYHYSLDTNVPQDVDEMIAYSNGLVEPLPYGESMETIVSLLERKYFIAHDRARCVVESVLLMRAHGFSAKQVADIVLSLEHQTGWEISEALHNYCADHQVLQENESENQTKINTYILARKIETVKARLLFLDVFEKNIAKE